MGSEQNLNRFEYDHSLDETSFRVLELLPGSFEDQVSYRLRAEHWNDPPAYEAISYAWGNPCEKVPSICNGARLDITPNFSAALRQLRRPNESRLPWADAACINQRDLAEQGYQVSHIQLIYERAQRVVVWLGEDEDDKAVGATKLVREIACESCAQEGITYDELRTRDRICNLTLRVMGSNLAHANDEDWEALAWLFKRSWFSRLWVFQEVNCGRNCGRSVLMICGSHHVPYDFVTLAANHIRARPWFSRRPEFATGFYENACIMRRRYLHEQSSVLHILNSTKNFVTSDPLDRVYALMATPPFLKMRPPLKVDHRKSKLELYTELARRCICDNGDLGVLAYAVNATKEGDFPSWVPDWTEESEYEIDHPRTKALSASGSTCFEGSVPADLILSARRVSFDVVDHVVKIDILRWLELYGISMPQQATQVVAEEGPIKLVRRIDSDGFLGDPDLQTEGTRGSIRAFLEGFLNYAALLLEYSKRDQIELQVEDEEKLPGRRSSIQIEPTTKPFPRTFFRTETGVMGFGPISAVKGDVVSLLFGGRAPFILRKVDDHYLHIGPTYTDGIMHGEAFTGEFANTLDEQVFDIH